MTEQTMREKLVDCVHREFVERAHFGIERPSAEGFVDALLSVLAEPDEGMVGKALSAFYDNGVKTCSTREAIRAAITAAINKAREAK